MLATVNMTGLNRFYWIPKFDGNRDEELWFFSVKWLGVQYSLLSPAMGKEAVRRIAESPAQIIGELQDKIEELKEKIEEVECTLDDEEASQAESFALYRQAQAEVDSLKAERCVLKSVLVDAGETIQLISEMAGLGVGIIEELIEIPDTRHMTSDQDCTINKARDYTESYWDSIKAVQQEDAAEN